MNISNGRVLPGFGMSCKEKRTGNGWMWFLLQQMRGKNVGIRFSKSSQLWKDLLSHLNLYNPMNISLGGNTFIATDHKYKSDTKTFSFAITN